MMSERLIESIKKNWDEAESLSILDSEAIEVNLRDLSGNTPLILAMNRGQSVLARRLCEMGSDVNASNNFHSSAIYWAANVADVEMFKYLLGLGALYKHSNLGKGFKNTDVDVVSALFMGYNATGIEEKHQRFKDIVDVILSDINTRSDFEWLERCVQKENSEPGFGRTQELSTYFTSRFSIYRELYALNDVIPLVPSDNSNNCDNFGNSANATNTASTVNKASKKKI